MSQARATVASLALSEKKWYASAFLFSHAEKGCTLFLTPRSKKSERRVSFPEKNVKIVFLFVVKGNVSLVRELLTETLCQ